LRPSTTARNCVKTDWSRAPGAVEYPRRRPLVGPGVDLYVDRTRDGAVASACHTLILGLQRSNRHGYLRVSAETDHVTGVRIARAIGELASVTVRPGQPEVVSVGLNAVSADAVTEILRDLSD